MNIAVVIYYIWRPFGVGPTASRLDRRSSFPHKQQPEEEAGSQTWGLLTSEFGLTNEKGVIASGKTSFVWKLARLHNQSKQADL